ncbi:hypothetical protein D3C79_1031730 [compost metagenome]
MHTLGQVAHFIGDHGKTTTRFTGTRRLDGGVERQQIGLLRNATDYFEDLADVHRIGVECFDVVA